MGKISLFQIIIVSELALVSCTLVLCISDRYVTRLPTSLLLNSLILSRARKLLSLIESDRTYFFLNCHRRHQISLKKMWMARLVYKCAILRLSLNG